jgi:hypothetical protein
MIHMRVESHTTHGNQHKSMYTMLDMICTTYTVYRTAVVPDNCGDRSPRFRRLQRHSGVLSCRVLCETERSFVFLSTRFTKSIIFLI